jgi:hypothetical protein
MRPLKALGRVDTVEPGSCGIPHLKIEMWGTRRFVAPKKGKSDAFASTGGVGSARKRLVERYGITPDFAGRLGINSA